MPATNKRFIAYDETEIFESGTTPEQALKDVRRRNNLPRIQALMDDPLIVSPRKRAVLRTSSKCGRVRDRAR